MTELTAQSFQKKDHDAILPHDVVMTLWEDGFAISRDCADHNTTIALRNDHVMVSAIHWNELAPFISEGSFLEFRNEKSWWRISFNGKEAFYMFPNTVWER